MVSTRYKHLCYGWIIREARKKPAVQENLGRAKTTSSSPQALSLQIKKCQYRARHHELSYSVNACIICFIVFWFGFFSFF
jgi:hypothetical protein